MPENNKLKKLAAARKKLKEYQAKDKHVEVIQSNDVKGSDTQDYDEHSHNPLKESREEIKKHAENSMTLNTAVVEANSNKIITNKSQPNLKELSHIENQTHTSTIELLIAEKSILQSELIKSQSETKEKSLEIEEVRESLKASNARLEELETIIIQLQSQNSNLSQHVEKLKQNLHSANVEITKLQTENTELTDHISELKHSSNLGISKIKDLEEKLKEKECEVELNKIRINQISDEVSVETDSKVETLTQTKFVYEQQIRDLQLMVQQLELEREQGNQQYQSYVQHLNKDIAAISEKNLKLIEENTNLSKQEQNLISHIGDLEKQIQQHISQKKQLDESVSEIKTERVESTNKHLSDNELEEIVSARTQILQQQLDDMKKTLENKSNIIETLEKENENLKSLKADSCKLLAEIESDKLAASRAVSQNEELKKQIDEIQIKLIQLTNDKADLINLLDSEQYSNREMHSNYSKLEEEIMQINKKLHFKDEEMIRLTNENMILNEQIEKIKIVDNKKKNSTEMGISESETHEKCEVLAADIVENGNTITDHETNTGLAPSTAMQKLEERFKSLMSDIANLTEEKQRLEHLVLQLQGETETIGEYVSLYQTQRRMLKQREIEKNCQLQQIAIERDQMKEKILSLSNLINKLNQQFTHDSAESRDGSALKKQRMVNDDLKNTPCEESDPKDIIYTIQNIISDIKETQKGEVEFKILPSLDHCSCCSGKFETI